MACIFRHNSLRDIPNSASVSIGLIAVLTDTVQPANRIDKEVVGRLRSAIKAAGGPSDVARRSGIPLSTLNGYLRGVEPKLGSLVALAEACAVSVQWLATGRESPAAAAATTPQPSVAPALLTIVDMALFDGAVQGAIDLCHQRGLEPAGHNFAVLVCALYDQMKVRKDTAIAAGLYTEDDGTSGDTA